MSDLTTLRASLWNAFEFRGTHARPHRLLQKKKSVKIEDPSPDLVLRNVRLNQKHVVQEAPEEFVKYIEDLLQGYPHLKSPVLGDHQLQFTHTKYTIMLNANYQEFDGPCSLASAPMVDVRFYLSIIDQTLFLFVRGIRMQ